MLIAIDYSANNHAMYEDEELSELSEEEDELVADKKNHASGSRSHKAVVVGYSLQKALKPPRATTYTAQALYGACWCCSIKHWNAKTE